MLETPMASRKPLSFERKRMYAPAQGEMADAHEELNHGDCGPAVAAGFALFLGLSDQSQMAVVTYIKALDFFDIGHCISNLDVQLIASGKLDPDKALDKAKKRATKE